MADVRVDEKPETSPGMPGMNRCIRAAYPSDRPPRLGMIGKSTTVVSKKSAKLPATDDARRQQTINDQQRTTVDDNG